jgi:glucose-6-phosphate 1-dehydrogenase
MFDVAIGGVMGAGLQQGARVVVEKPFGRDLASARELNTCLHRAFDERAIYRTDHYLGKETVQNLLAFLSRIRCSSLSGTGVTSRACRSRRRSPSAWKDAASSTRGWARSATWSRTTCSKWLPCWQWSRRSEPTRTRCATRRSRSCATTSVDPAVVVRGQYDGYRSEAGVQPDSDVETYIALRLETESRRWAGVPFFLRAGKRLGEAAVEAVIEFNEPPRPLVAEVGTPVPHPNHLHLRLRLGGGGEGIELSLQAKVPGATLETQAVPLGFSYERSLGEQAEAYERLLFDAIEGHQALFTRQDGVEECWRIVEPVLHPTRPVHRYVSGSWGPGEADDLIGPTGSWHTPEAAA